MKKIIDAAIEAGLSPEETASICEHVANTMEPLKHTPGPWKSTRDDETTLLVVSPWSEINRVEDGGTFGDYRGAHICTLKHLDAGSVPTPGQAEANARLISAAPELLAAAAAAARQLESMCASACARHMSVRWTPADTEALNALVAAIAKAKGQ